MRVKRYVANSMPEALQMIRSELGSDAVILNSKEIRTGGFLGMFGKRKIEVVAAMDEPPAQAKVPTAARPAPASPGPAPQPPEAAPFPAALYGAAQAVRAYTQTAAASATVKPEEEAARREKDHADPERLMDEIRQMKEMMARLSRRLEQGEEHPEAYRKLEGRLRAQEVEQAVIDRLIGDAARELADCGEREALELVRAGLRRILQPERVRGIEPGSRILHFVGPTGVGKTTTIAKLAADQALRHRKRIGFMTSDTYRIAAVEQLKTYATILNAPLEVIHSPMDLGRAFRQLDSCDLIFMDTAGRNYRNELYVSELNSLLSSGDASETFLVLSMTTRYRDMKAIVDAFSRFRLDKVLFTKVDETTTFGAPVNLLSEYPLKLSYIANGQNVPDDISLFHPERWIDRLLEENIDGP